MAEANLKKLLPGGTADPIPHLEVGEVREALATRESVDQQAAAVAIGIVVPEEPGMAITGRRAHAGRRLVVLANPVAHLDVTFGVANGQVVRGVLVGTRPEGDEVLGVVFVLELPLPLR